jgi:hypothetical protein
MTSNIYERVVLDEGDGDTQARRSLQLSKELQKTLPQYPFWHPKHVQYADLTSGFLHPIITPPFYARIEKFQAPLLGMFRCVASYAVSATAIELTESVDPGVHRHHPFDLTMADGSPTPEPYMLLNIGQRADTIALEASPHMVKRMNDKMVGNDLGTYPDWYDYVIDNKRNYPSSAVYKDKVKDLSIWYDHKLNEIMICDKLMALFIDHGILRLEEEAPYFLWQLREV